MNRKISTSVLAAVALLVGAAFAVAQQFGTAAEAKAMPRYCPPSKPPPLMVLTLELPPCCHPDRFAASRQLPERS